MIFGEIKQIGACLLVTLVYLVTSSSAFSQSPVVIEGHILTQDNSPVVAANVLLMPLNSNRVVASYISDEDGAFGFYPSKTIDSDSLRIHVMRVGIKAKSFVVPNRSDYKLVLTVTEETFNLNELVVKAEKVRERGDTLQYMVGAFQSVTDKNLADVLRKMPGISVDKDGKIRYQGEAISTLYIDGLNMLRGQYGVATNNIHPDDIASVEILQNHQEIEALKEISDGERAAINILLKESSRGVWASRVSLAAGIVGNDKWLWDGKLMTSRFARGNQQLTLIKGNNRGLDISRDLNSYDRNGLLLPVPVASINVNQASMLDDEYYRDNQDLTSSLNTIFRIKEKTTTGVNITYAHIEDKPTLREVSTYVLPTGEKVIFDERSKGVFVHNTWSGNVFYQANKTDYYLDSQINFKVADRKSNTQVISEMLYDSRQHETPYRLGYNLECLKVYGNNRVSIHSKSHYQNHVQNLSLNQSAQEIIETNASSHTAVKISNFGSLIPRASLFFSLFYEYDASTIALAPYLVSFPSHIAGTSLGMYYQHKGVNFNLNLRLGYADKTLRPGGKESHLSYADFTPSLSLKYVPWRNVAILLDYNFIQNTPNIRRLYTFPILIGHRTSSSYEGELFLSSYHNVGSKITYKHVPSMLFTVLDISYSRISPNRLFGSYLSGNRIIVSTMPTMQQGENLSATVSISKGFYWKATKIGVEISRIKTEMPILLQNEVLRLDSRQWLISLDVYMRPWQFMEIEMDSKYQYLSNNLENGVRQSHMRYLSNSIGLTLKPTKQLYGYVGYHHYLNLNNDGDKNFYLCDLSIGYEFDRWSLFGKVNNLFDIQSYTYTSLSSINRYDMIYPLRKRYLLLGVRFKLF